jgi:hypothetical protein
VFARLLTRDQRLALAAQIGQVPPGVFCRHVGWSIEKYRKVAQRGRARLSRLVRIDEGEAPARGGSVLAARRPSQTQR